MTRSRISLRGRRAILPPDLSAADYADLRHAAILLGRTIGLEASFAIERPVPGVARGDPQRGRAVASAVVVNDVRLVVVTISLLEPILRKDLSHPALRRWPRGLGEGLDARNNRSRLWRWSWLPVR